MSLVLDASLTVSWFFADEQTPHGMAVLDRVSRQGAVVPSLWRLEVANALQMAVRRRRMDRSFRDSNLADLGAMNIEIDGQTNVQAWSATVRLADAHDLTIYDAAYLELALRRKLPLATLDAALAAAARAERIPLI